MEEGRRSGDVTTLDRPLLMLSRDGVAERLRCLLLLLDDDDDDDIVATQSVSASFNTIRH